MVRCWKKWKKMQIKGILFDKDGTLIDFNAVWLTAAKEVVRFFIQINGLEYSTEVEKRIYQAIGMEQERVIPNGPLAYQTYYEIGTGICKELQKMQIELDTKLVERQLSVLFESVCARKDFSYHPIVDLKPLFTQLSENGLKIGLATADTKSSVERCFTSLGVLDDFEYLGYDDGTLQPKPAGDMFFAFAKKCSLKPSEILVVGDTKNDMIFAHRYGGIGVGVLSGVSKKQDFGKEADFVVDTVAELPDLLRTQLAS